MDRELNATRTIYKSYVIDDGWNLPKEVVEVIDMKVELAWKQAYKRVCREHDRHQGKWIDEEICRKYHTKSLVWRVWYSGQYTGKVREIGEELQRDYGVTEIEAINILSGKHIRDYVSKYYRIQNRIPVGVNSQKICDWEAQKYLTALKAM